MLSAGADRAVAAPGVQIIPETAAARHGLTRPWFTQAQVDRSRGKIEHMVLFDGTLFVQTDRGVLQTIDAETGRTLWAKELGRRDFPSMQPAINGEMVAVINGSTLYILHRPTGRLLWQRAVQGVPGAGPALSQLRAYVPMTDGLVLAYRLEPVTDPAVELGMLNPESEEDAKALQARRLEGMRLQQDLKPPLACQSFGRAMVQPLVIRENAGEESVAWPTDRGYLFVGRIDRASEDRFEMQYKLETGADITARPTFVPAATEEASDSGVLFAPSQDGFLHAIRERDGTSLWRFSTGEPVLEPAAPIADKVYVTTQLGGMYCLAVATGQQLWWTPGIMKFIAASKDRVYGEDRSGNVVVLHAQTGGRLDVIPAAGLPIKLMNLQTDRIYLAAETGLIQCFHEIELATPILHRPKPVPKQEKPKPKKTEVVEPARPKAPPTAAGGAAPADSPFGGAGGVDPFGGGAAPADSPFGAGGVDPFGGGAAPADSPFGSGGGGAPADNPFGGGTDPFGGGTAPADNPFGGASGGGGTPANDPFG
jgi:outer membrane protein assembly factor BamB